MPSAPAETPDAAVTRAEMKKIVRVFVMLLRYSGLRLRLHTHEGAAPDAPSIRRRRADILPFSDAIAPGAAQLDSRLRWPLALSCLQAPRRYATSQATGRDRTWCRRAC